MKGICSIFFPQVFFSSWDFFNPAMFRGHSLKAIRLGVQNSSRSIIKKNNLLYFFSPSCIIFYFLYLAITVEKQQDFIAIVNTITDQKSSHIFAQHMLSSVQSESWIFRGEWQFFSYRSLIFCCWLHVLCGTVAYLISSVHYIWPYSVQSRAVHGAVFNKYCLYQINTMWSQSKFWWWLIQLNI